MKFKIKTKIRTKNISNVDTGSRLQYNVYYFIEEYIDNLHLDIIFNQLNKI